MIPGNTITELVGEMADQSKNSGTVNDKEGKIHRMRGIYIVLPKKEQFELTKEEFTHGQLIDDYAEVEIEYENEHIILTFQELLDKIGFKQQKTEEKCI